MARKRMIDPSIWQDEEFGSLTANAKIMFIGLFSNADDEGRIRASHAYLKSTIFMYDDASLELVRQVRNEVVEKMSTIQLYEIDGKEYIQLKNWNEYQKQHKDRVQESTLPSYKEDVSDNVGQATDNVGVSKDKLSKDKLSKDNIPAVSPQVSSKKEIKTYERLPVEKQQPIHRICYHLEDVLHTQIVVWGKQADAMKMMFQAGYTENQIKWTIDQMAKDDFYQDKGFDLKTVANNIDKYKAKARKGTHVLQQTN